jgi:formylglycine-generating enzyme required for sulfatase activity
LGDCESAIAHAVGAKQPNDFGLYDVLGNVWEWTADTHSATYYEVSPGINPTGPEKGNYKVLRGGSCDPFDSADVRVSARLADEPVQGVYDYGARCARDAEP